jgi:hypothetical protein
MKQIALLALCLLAVAAPAFAINGVGDISIYADDQGNSCALLLPGGPPVDTYIVQKFLPGEGSTGCRFKVIIPNGVFSSFSTTFVPVGNYTGDLSIAYGVCIQTTTVIGKITFFTAAPTCGYVSIVAADNFANPIATDCLFGEYTVKTGQGIMNPDGTCVCQVANQPTSWGKVKALYR